MAQPDPVPVSSVNTATPTVALDSNTATSGAPPAGGSPGATVKGLTPSTPRVNRYRRPWWSHPYVILAVLLIPLIVELGIAQTMTWKMFLLVNVAALLSVIVALIVWQKVRHWIRSRAARRAASPRTRSGGYRTTRTTGSRSRLPGIGSLLGRSRRTPGSATTGGRQARSGGVLGRLFPSHRRGQAASSGSTRRGATSGPTSRRGGRTTSGPSWGSRLRNLAHPLGRNNSGSSRYNRRPQKGATSHPIRDAVKTWNDAKKRGTKLWNAVDAWRQKGRKKEDPKSTKSAKAKSDEETPQAPERDAKKEEQQHDDAAVQPAVPVPTALPQHRATPGGSMNGSDEIRYNDDSSLQGWGRNLKTIAPALRDMARRRQALENEEAAAFAAIQNLATQGENDLPAGSAITSEMQNLAAQVRTEQGNSGAARLRRLADQADALPGTYERDHETDEDRMHTPRKSRQHERRADVAAAEQDI